MISSIVIELTTEQNVGIPCEFIIDNIRYSKQLDGFYHKFIVGSPIRKESSIGFISIGEAKNIYETIRFKTPIMFCTNNVNCK